MPILSWHGLLLFTAGELLFSLSPGPTVMLVCAHGFRGGMRAALAAIGGVQAGNTVWYLFSILGLGVLVAAWPQAFHAMKLLGAIYLAVLGAMALWHSRRPHDMRTPAAGRAPFAQALLNQLGNPKAMLFFAAFQPQFIATTAPLAPQYAVLFAVTLLGESIVLAGYGWLAAHGAQNLRHALWRERIGGAAMIALGIAFAAAP